MKRWTILTIVLIFISLPAFAQTVEKQIVHEFQVAAGSTLNLSNIVGDVVVTGWDKQIIRIEVLKKAKGNNAQKMISLLDIKASQRGNRVECETDYPGKKELRKHGFSHKYHAWAEYKVFVPNDCSLDELQVVSGDLEVNGVSGRHDITVVSGDFKASNLSGKIEIGVTSGELVADGINGEIELVVTSGDIEVSRMTGILETSVTSGDITVDAIDLEGMTATVTSGDITVTPTSPITFGKFRIKAFDGDVTFTFPENSAFEISGKTSTGSIRSDFPFAITKKIMKREIRGSHNGGGADVIITSFTGSIILKK